MKSLKRVRCGKIPRIIKKRRRSRKAFKMKRKLEKLQKSFNISPQLECTQPISAECKYSSSDVVPDAKLLKRRHDAECFLQKFQLLERLHLARSQDIASSNEFARKLDTLRRIWINELRASTTHQTLEEKESIESLWNKVLFGDEKNENTVYGKQKLKDFLRIRNIWDSYLSKSPEASSIPNGWVLPPRTPSSMWRKYQSEEL